MCYFPVSCLWNQEFKMMYSPWIYNIKAKNTNAEHIKNSS